MSLLIDILIYPFCHKLITEIILILLVLMIEKIKLIFALPNVHDLDESARVASVIDYR